MVHGDDELWPRQAAVDVCISELPDALQHLARLPRSVKQVARYVLRHQRRRVAAAHGAAEEATVFSEVSSRRQKPLQSKSPTWGAAPTRRGSCSAWSHLAKVRRRHRLHLDHVPRHSAARLGVRNEPHRLHKLRLAEHAPLLAVNHRPNIAQRPIIELTPSE